MMIDDYTDHKALKSIEVTIDVTNDQYAKLSTAMFDNVLLVVTGCRVPFRDHGYDEFPPCSVTLKSIGTTARLRDD
ncbi:MAG: hypothetical protein WC322_03275 [Candidatus Paceibacterota bacterium]